MKRKIMRIGLAVMMILGLAAVVFANGAGRAKAAQRVVIDTTKLQEAFDAVSRNSGRITSITFNATGYTGSGAYSLNSAGTVVATFQNGVFTIRPKTTGDTVALAGDCSLLFSPYKYSGSMVLDDLQSVNLSGIDTSEVTNLLGCFNAQRSGYISKLTTVNLSGCNFSGVTSLSAFCAGCSALTSITMDWNTITAVTNLNNMFEDCGLLTSIPGIGEMGTSNVTTAVATFRHCSGLTAIPIGSWNLTNLTKADGMFLGTGITAFSFSDFHVNYAKLTGMTGLLQNCESLTSVDMSAMTYVGNSVVRRIDSMFAGCSSLKSLKMGKLNLDNTSCTMINLFDGCTQLETLDLSDFRPGGGKSLNCLFNNCTKLKSVDCSMFVSASDLTGMFAGCESLQSVKIAQLTTTSVTSMSQMFLHCKSLTYLDLSGFSCKKLTDARGMFDGCTNLRYVDLSGFSTSNNGSNNFNATDMFFACPNLECINFRSLQYNVSAGNVTDMFGAYGYPGAFDEKLKHICTPSTTLATALFETATGQSAEGLGVQGHQIDFSLGKCTACGSCIGLITGEGHIYDNTYKCSYCKVCRSVLETGAHSFDANGVCPCGASNSTQLNISMQYSLTLNSNIEVVLAFDIPSDLTNDANAYIQITSPGGTKNYPIATADTIYIDHDPWRSIRYSLPAKRMTDEATVKVYDGAGNLKFTAEDKVSVTNYAKLILTSSGYDQKTKDLVKAMLNYGAYAQKYFNYNTNILANAGYAMTLPSNADTLAAIGTFAVTVDDNAPGVNYVGCSLLLEDEISVRFWYSFDSALSAAQKNAYISSMGLKAGSGGRYYHDGTPYAVGGWGYPVISGDSDITVTYSPMAYVSDVLKTASNNTNLSNLVKAMYLYWNAAMAYTN